MTKLSYHEFLGVGHHVWGVNYSHGRHRNRNVSVQTAERDEAAVRKHRAFAGKRGLQIHSIEYRGVRGAPKESVEENVRWVGGYKNALAAHREDERDQRKPRARSKRSKGFSWADRKDATGAVLRSTQAYVKGKHGRNEEMDESLRGLLRDAGKFDRKSERHAKSASLWSGRLNDPEQQWRHAGAQQSHGSRAHAQDSHDFHSGHAAWYKKTAAEFRRTHARAKETTELRRRKLRGEDVLGFRDHLDEERARSRGMNRDQTRQRPFISGDNVVGRVLDTDERARVKRIEARRSSPRNKPTMPRFSFSGKPMPEERVDEWTREQAAVRRAAKTVRARSGYSIRASVNIADTKTKGGTRKLLGVEGLRKRRLRDSVREERVDELHGKGRFGEIRMHAKYRGDKHTADRADAMIDDASRERRAELRAKSRAKRRGE